MKKIGLLFTLLLTFVFQSAAQYEEEEPYKSNKTYSYEEVIGAYKKLNDQYPETCRLMEFGRSDIGEPMHLFLMNNDGKFDTADFKDKAIILVNNGIHPGEPCGVDASIKLSKNYLSGVQILPENVIIGIIPMYNIGGALNRNCCTRTNQNGPEMYGFRGNAKNLDLNRDYIKADSKNVRAFYQIYHYLNPHVFVDTHTSNGADYQHVMTLITSQHDKMHPDLQEYVLNTLNPKLWDEMAKDGWNLVPYVYSMEETPDKGIKDYMDSPRYSTGYTNLFNTISYVTEAHMLKPFDQRVESTYDFLWELINVMNDSTQKFIALKAEADKSFREMEEFGLEWKLDTSKYEMITFNGYTAEYRPSNVSGKERLFYNQDKPFTREIRYYNHYAVGKKVNKPAYYVIPQAWEEVVTLLRENKIEVYELKANMELEVEVYFVADYETVKNPYEGHYLHHDIDVVKDTLSISYRKGDYIIPTNNEKARFIVETLEPHATDSYLAWNYFDAILQQKEWFSSYVFEDEASLILENNPALKKSFEEKKANDAEFANDGFAQLYYIYKHSDHYEPTHKRYPVTRLTTELKDDQLKRTN